VSIRAVILICLGLLSWLTITGSVAAPSEEAAKRLAWQNEIQHSVPKEPGCYQAKNYPSQEWTKIPCVAGLQPQEKVPALRARPADVLPGGTAYTLSVPTGTLTSVTGFIQDIQNFTTVSSGTTTNTYSLQLNSDFFYSPKCGSKSSCRGWEQFVFMNYGGSATLGIEVWLVNYLDSTTTTCPDGFVSAAPNCHAGPVSTQVPEVQFADLKGTTFTGTADPDGLDRVVITFGESSSTPPTAVVADSTVSFAANWQAAQFNVFGQGNYEVATFNPGALVKISVQGTPSQAGVTATCTLAAQGTGETSNLGLLPPCASDSAAVPTFTFQEASAPQLTDMRPTVSPTNGGIFITLSGEGMTSSMVVEAGKERSGCAVSGNTCRFGSPAGTESIGVSVANNYPSVASGQGNVLGPFSNQLYLAFRNPAPPCTSCGPGRKCCRNPDGGPGIVCVLESLNCPVLH
jgi:hypothetical protein